MWQHCAAYKVKYGRPGTGGKKVVGGFERECPSLRMKNGLLKEWEEKEVVEKWECVECVAGH